jgi:hypothetical protein
MNTKDLLRDGAPKPPSERGKFPARLHVFLARDAKIGLVIRRGLSTAEISAVGSGKNDWRKVVARFQPDEV